MCQPPPILSRWSGSLRTWAICGYPSTWVKKRLTSIGAHRLREGDVLFRLQGLVAKEDDPVVTERTADLGELLAGNLIGEIDTVDFRTERTGPPAGHRWSGSVSVMIGLHWSVRRMRAPPVPFTGLAPNRSTCS